MAVPQLSSPDESGHHASPQGHARQAGLVLDLLAPLVQELAKTVLLLAVLMLALWGVLEIFRAGSTGGVWYERLWHTFARARLNVDGLPIAPRFLSAARESLAIVLVAAALLGPVSMATGSAFALKPSWSVLRLPLVLVSAVPAFMLPSLGMPRDPAWLWAAVCLALGDLNAAALTAQCYEGVRRELNQPYIRTALAQGLSRWSDLWPRATLIAVEGITARIPHLLGGTVAIEYAYNIHGIGHMALDAVVFRRTPDYNVLIWIAGLGVVATRALSLFQRLARAVLTPERGKATTWAGVSLGAGLRALWQAAGGTVRGSGFRVQEEAASAAPVWLSASEPPLTVAHPSRCRRGTLRLRAFWKASQVNRTKFVLAVLTALVGTALLAIVLWGGGYSMLETDAPSLPSSWAHSLGTNDEKEDVLSKIALGGRQLVLPLLAAVGAAIALGGFFGTLSGLCLGSTADAAMNLFAELCESIPKLVLVLAAITYMSFEHYALKLYLLTGLAFAPLLYRAVRNEVGALRTSQFLEASIALGIPRRRILWTHVLRNHVLPVLCLEGAVMVGYVLLFDAILGYCYVRQRAEVFTWGSLLGTAVEELPKQIEAGVAANPWIMWGPFAATLIAITVSAVAGDALKSLGRSVRASH